MPRSLTVRFFVRLGRSVLVRPLGVAAIFLATIGICLAVSRLTEWSDHASIMMVLKPIATSGSAGAGSQETVSSAALPVYRDLVRSNTVLLRTLTVVDDPNSPGATAWQKAREGWETAHSPEAWGGLEQALQQLDAEIQRRRSGIEGPAILERLAQLSERVSVSGPGSQESLGCLKVSVSWPVKSGDVRQVAGCLSKMVCDRVQEAQMKAAHETADFVRLRREALRPNELAPAENALKQFIDRELESPADLMHLEQISKLGAEADLPVFIRRLRLELETLDSQRADAIRLRRQLLEPLPASLWGGGARCGDDGDLTAPDVAMVGEKKLSGNDLILTQLTLVIPKEALDRNVVLSRLKAREAELLLELYRLRSEFNPTHLAIGDKQSELVRVRREILTQVIGEAAQLQVSAASLKDRHEELTRRLEASQRQFQRLNGKLGRYQELVQDLDSARKRYLQTWLDETETIRNQEQGLPAVVPQVLDISGDYAGRRALLANPWKAAVAGGIAGLLLALAYALVADRLDRTLRWPDDVQRQVGIRVVGRVKRAGDRIVA